MDKRRERLAPSETSPDGALHEPDARPGQSDARMAAAGRNAATKRRIPLAQAPLHAVRVHRYRMRRLRRTGVRAESAELARALLVVHRDQRLSAVQDEREERVERRNEQRPGSVDTRIRRNVLFILVL